MNKVKVVLAIVFLLIAGCNMLSDEPQTGKEGDSSDIPLFVDLTINLGSLSRNNNGDYEDVVRVTIYVSHGLEYLVESREMVKTGGIWSITLNDLPTGINLIFETQAYNSEGEEIFTGSKVQSLSSANDTMLINMVPYTEVIRIPRILEITRFERVFRDIASNVKVEFSANVDEILSYLFYPVISGDGTFSPASGTVTLESSSETIESMLLPITVGVNEYTVQASNDQGNIARANFTIETIEAPAEPGTGGGGEVILSFPPTVQAITASKRGDNVTWEAVVTDDGLLSEIVYAWEYGGSTEVFEDPSVNPVVMKNYTPDMQGKLTLTMTDKNGTGVSSAVEYTMLRNQFPGEETDPVMTLTTQQSIGTNGARDIEAFTIGTTHYLAVANYQSNPIIYRWSSGSFVEVQTIPVSDANDCEVFRNGADRYLAVASTKNGHSTIYKWEETRFIEMQSISGSIYDFEAFRIGAETHLAAATSGGTSIYKWNSGRFISAQYISTGQSQDVEPFVIGTETYLAVASFSASSRLYKWDGEAFQEHQEFAGTGSYGWEVFIIGGETFLAQANYYINSSYSTNSPIYKWNGTSFEGIQDISTMGAIDWKAFTAGTDTYLAVANHYSGSNYSRNSIIYKWDGSSFILERYVRTQGAYDWEVFTINGSRYLGIANEYNGSSYTLNSPIYLQDWE